MPFVEFDIRLSTGDSIDDMVRALDLVPPRTKLADVVQQLEVYRASEEVVMGDGTSSLLLKAEKARTHLFGIR